MKKAKVKLLQLSIYVLTFFAMSTAVFASSLMGYQPEMPKELQERE